MKSVKTNLFGDLLHHPDLHEEEQQLRSSYSFVLVGAGLAHLLLAEKLAKTFGPGKVLVLDRAPLFRKGEFKDFPPPASLSTPGRGGLGVGHFPDAQTYEMILSSLFLLLEIDPDLNYFDGRETDYLILSDSVPDPQKLKNVYEQALNVYKFYYEHAAVSVQRRLPEPEKFAVITSPDQVPYLSQEIKRKLAYVVKTLEGRLDMAGAHDRAITRCTDAGVIILDNTNVIDIESLSPGEYQIHAQRLTEEDTKDTITIETNRLSISAWYNTISLLNKALTKPSSRLTQSGIAEPFTYRIKQIVELLVPVCDDSSSLHSFFIGMGAKGCMLAIDKTPEHIVIIEGKKYWPAKATSVKHTNVEIIQESEHVEAALARHRNDKFTRQVRSENILKDVNSAISRAHTLRFGPVLYRADELQVVVTHKIDCAPEEDIVSVVEKGMSDSTSAFNTRQSMVNCVFVPGAPSDSCVVIAPNVKLITAAKTAEFAFKHLEAAANNENSFVNTDPVVPRSPTKKMPDHCRTSRGGHVHPYDAPRSGIFHPVARRYHERRRSSSGLKRETTLTSPRDPVGKILKSSFSSIFRPVFVPQDSPVGQAFDPDIYRTPTPEEMDVVGDAFQHKS